MKTNSCWSKMACGNMYACVCIILLISFIEGCEGPVDLLCHKNDDCIDGYLCNSESKCVKSDTPNTPDLSFVTKTVKTAIIGGNYSDPPAQLIEVQGGLSPKQWVLTIDDANKTYLDWLEIDANSGLLRNVQGKSPKEITSTASFTVEVKDGSNVGQGVTISKSYTMVIKECVEPMPCYVNKSYPAGVCFLGTKQCIAEKLSSTCEPGDQTSSDRLNCGSTCGQCEPNIADSCQIGVCSCGSSGSVCDLSVTPVKEERCCNTSCVNVMMGDMSNCGACNTPTCAGKTPACCGGQCVDLNNNHSYCGTDASHPCGYTCSDAEICCGGKCVNCSSVQNATGVHCNEATNECDYDSCVEGWDDCDKKHNNGCEKEMTDISCGCKPVTDCSKQNENKVCVNVEYYNRYQCGCKFTNSDKDCIDIDNNSKGIICASYGSCYCYYNGIVAVLCDQNQVCCTQQTSQQNMCCSSCDKCPN